jgi:MoaA/NifB/PqqE/SkfB family radical SAM enzyme
VTPAPLPLAPPRARGWLLPVAGLAVLDDGERLALVDADGREVGTFRAGAAAALRSRLDGGGSGPLLERLLGGAPALAAVLDGPALPLEPAALLRRGGWSQLFLELTAACNERCVHCYAEADPERREALDRGTVERALEEAAGLGFRVVQLTGGEALLVPWLADAVRRAADLGIPVREVYTNGTLLDAARYAPLRAAGASFAFSLYAADPAAHDAVTGLPGSHARTCAAIRRALDGGSAVRVGVIVTRPADQAEAVRAAALARELGVPAEQVGLSAARPVGRARGATALEGELAPAGWGPAVHAPSAPSAPGSVGGRGKAAVLPDGAVVPCIFARAPRLGRVGPAGGLRRALLAPAVALRALDPAAAAAALRGAACGLSCGECRWPAALLEPAR